MYSMMSGRQMYAPVVRTSTQFAKYGSQGTPVHGNAHSSVYHRQNITNQLRPAVFADHGHGPGSQSVGDASQSPTVQACLQPTLSPTVDNATAPSDVPDSESAPATDAPASPSGADAEHSDLPLANIKEKTPMCLINELARFNKVQHQYCLTDEQGPAHRKVFFVKLKLGEEEFAASGASIKKAQHAAAATALESTKLPRPPPKRLSTNAAVSVSKVGVANSSITPTVELNALAMKRGELAVYRPIETKPLAPAPHYCIQTYSFRGGYYNHRYRYPKPIHIYRVSLKVGEREFFGEGETMQAARHCAATMALSVLRALPLPTREHPVDSETTEDDDETASGKVNDSLKSDISLVHEIALKRKFSVEFTLVKESGPAHMRTYVTQCQCGHLTAEGDGSSKKLSKKRAAEKMVIELKKLPPLSPPPPSAKPKKIVTKPKQTKNLIKNVTSTSAVGVNPISRLIQIQQAKKEKEPLFTLVSEYGVARSREFMFQVMVGDSACTGVGPNKKLAKREAAEQMLLMLGYSLTPPPPAKPALKTLTDTAASGGAAAVVNTSATSSDKHVTFAERDMNTMRPGLITITPAVQSMMVSSTSAHVNGTVGTTADADAAVGNTSGRHGAATLPFATCQVRPLDQLKYLAKVMGFEIQVTSIPKNNNKTEYVSVVTLCTSPPQFYNGVGATPNEAADTAAVDALQELSEVGLEGLCGQGLVGLSATESSASSHASSAKKTGHVNSQHE